MQKKSRAKGKDKGRYISRKKSFWGKVRRRNSRHRKEVISLRYLSEQAVLLKKCSSKANIIPSRSITANVVPISI